MKHLEELSAEVDTYMASVPLRLIWERVAWRERFRPVHGPESKLVGLVPRIREGVPENLSPIIGDVIHNLRSALDIMMTELVRELDPTADPRRVKFPTWKEATKPPPLPKAVGGTPIEALIAAWEPFLGGRSRLYALNELWSMDKHRSIIPIIGGVEYSQGLALCLHGLDGQEFIDPFPTRVVTQPGEPLMVSLEEIGAPLGLEVPCTFMLVLDGEPDVKGRELLGELKAQTNVVRSVLISFETKEPPYFSPPPPPGPVRIGEGSWMFPPSMSPDDVHHWIQGKLAKGWPPGFDNAHDPITDS